MGLGLWLDFPGGTGVVFPHFPRHRLSRLLVLRTDYGGFVELTRSDLPGKGVSEHSDCLPVVEERGPGAPEYL